MCKKGTSPLCNYCTVEKQLTNREVGHDEKCQSAVEEQVFFQSSFVLCCFFSCCFFSCCFPSFVRCCFFSCYLRSDVDESPSAQCEPLPCWSSIMVLFACRYFAGLQDVPRCQLSSTVCFAVITQRITMSTVDLMWSLHLHKIKASNPFFNERPHECYHIQFLKL